MKAILLAIRPEWLVKILNGEKTIEVRKLFPKDYVGWIYLYCSKGKELYKWSEKVGYFADNYCKKLHHQPFTPKALNGKVVARFWCDKIEGILNDFNTKYNVAICSTVSLFHFEILDKSCLRQNQLTKYLKNKNGFAIHISKLEIFDRPRELREFWNCGKQVRKGVFNYSIIHKAPQNYCYIEGE